MKDNSYFYLNFVEDSCLPDNGFSTTENSESHHKLSPDGKPKKFKNANFLNHLWHRLLHRPESFLQSPNTPICNILEDDFDKLAFDSITTVLSRKLELPIHSTKVVKAFEDSNKIFHEDFPGDFVLEYKGERLGMMMLDECSNSQGETHLIYRFNPKLKSFSGLF